MYDQMEVVRKLDLQIREDEGEPLPEPNLKEKTGSRIVWSNDETAKAGRRFARLMVALGKKELPPEGHDRSLLTTPIIGIAQGVLPPDRRRMDAAAKYASGYQRKFWEAVEISLKGLTTGEEPKTAPAPTPTNGHEIPVPPPVESQESLDDDPHPQDVTGDRSKGVIWTMQEATDVARKSAELMLKQNLHLVPDDRVGSGIMLDCIRAAQLAVLPRERRNLAGMTRARLGIRFWDPFRHFLKNPKLIQAPDEVAALKAQELADSGHIPAEPEPEGYLDLAETLEKLIAQLRPVLEDLSKVNELRGYQELMTDELNGLRNQVGNINARLATVEQAENESRAREGAPKKIRVAICCCEKHVFDHIVTGAKERDLDLDFRLYEQATTPKPIVADWAIIMKWGAHAWSEQAAHSIPRGQYTVLKGGITQALAQLEIWFKT